MPVDRTAADPDIAAAKLRLRREILARRRGLTPEVRAQAAARLVVALTGLVRQHAPRLVASYVPVGNEPGGPGLPQALADALPSGAGLLLPVLRDDLDLDWAAYQGTGSLRAVGRGLREPTGERLGPEVIAQAELIILPALAVDRAGVRLGRGGGSYDRVLARLGPRSLTVALLYDGELLPALPAEAHDRPVRATITPGGGLRTVTSG